MQLCATELAAMSAHPNCSLGLHCKKMKRHCEPFSVPVLCHHMFRNIQMGVRACMWKMHLLNLEVPLLRQLRHH